MTAVRESCGPGPGGGSVSVEIPVSSVRMRTIRARTATVSASTALTSASTTWRRFPSRRTRVDTFSGAIGTAPIRSSVRRAQRIGTGLGTRSTARAISAAGAPPCSARGSHGPRAAGPGTNVSPSVRNIGSVIAARGGSRA